MESVPTEARDYPAILEAYVSDVLKGRIPACKWTQLACRRHRADWRRSRRKKGWDYYFDPWYVADACGFLEKLPHVEGVWSTPTLLLEPSQVFIVGSVFGWRRVSDDLRRFTDVYLEVARKNAKSTLSAGIALYAGNCEGEPGPQVKIAATTADQARAVFNPAKAMCERLPALREAFGVEVRSRSIVLHGSNGIIEPINAKASTQDGLNPHVSIIDELHAHKERALYDVLDSARGARRNSLMWCITTAGYNLHGVAIELRTLLTKVLQGLLEADHIWGVIYTIDEGDDWLDESCWPKANPLIHVPGSPLLEQMRSAAKVAEASPARQGEFKTKRLNMWLGAANAWLNIERWDLCAADGLSMSDFEGEPLWAGVDLASKNDVAAAGALFERDGDLYGFARFWLPQDLLHDCAEKVNDNYPAWAERGLLTLTPGDMIDYDYIAEELESWAERFDLRALAFDPYQSHQLATRLENQGLPVVIVPNTVKYMSEPAKELEARVNVRRFRHAGCPVLRWMASNVVVFRDQKENIFPKKEAPNSPNKIDGIVALIMAAGRWLLQEGPETSVYEDRDLRVIG